MNDIQIQHLSKAFGSKQVLQDFSCTLPAGKCTALMGPSGSGKTTLINTLLGLVGKDSGEITGLPERISVVFQENRLCEDFTALENVAMVNQKSMEHARLLLEKMGLKDSLHQPVSALSGGMKRRVAIARALHFDAPFLIMDEPFKGLDEETKETVIQTVLEETKGKTLLLITHDEQEAKKCAGQTIMLA